MDEDRGQEKYYCSASGFERKTVMIIHTNKTSKGERRGGRLYVYGIPVG